MLQIKRTDSQGQDFIFLFKYPYAELILTDGEEHSFCYQFKKNRNIEFEIFDGWYGK
jgi:hypothetical protein